MQPDVHDGSRDEMTQAAPVHPRTRRRKSLLIAAGLFRAAVSAAVMVTAYYLLPLHARSAGFVVLQLTVGICLFVIVVAWQVRAITRSDRPRIRAIQALATAVPLFLLVFASIYYVMSLGAPATFSEDLDRSDALYLAITIFSTVGFGDITADATLARLVVAAQMLLDLIVLGLGVQVFVGAVERGKATNRIPAPAADPPDQSSSSG